MSGAIRTTKNATMLFAGTLTRMVASFGFIIYAANHLGVENFGKYALVVHYFELFISLTAAAAGILLTRDIARWCGNRDKLFTAAATLVSFFALLAPLILLPASIGLGYSRDTLLALAIVCLGLVPAAVGVVYEAVFVALERAEFVTAGATIESLFRVVVSLWVLWLGYGIVELAVVMVLSRVTLVIAYFGLLRYFFNHRLQFNWKATWRFASRWRIFAAENWMATIYTSLDVIVLSAFIGEAAVGLYSAAWRYVRLGSVMAKSFTTAVFPVLSRAFYQSRESFQQIFQHAMRGMCLIALPIVAGVTVIPQQVVDLIYKQEYAAAAPVLQVLIWILLLEFINPFLSHVLFSQGKQRLSMYVAAMGLISNSILMVVLVNQLGVIGAAYACVFSGLVATLCYLYFTAELGLLPVLLREILRISVAASVMGLAVYQVAEHGWLVIAPVSVGVYLLMLVVVQAIRMSDLHLIKEKFSHRAYAS